MRHPISAALLLGACTAAPPQPSASVITASEPTDRAASTDEPAPTADTGPLGDPTCNGYVPQAYTCTLVQGFSQTRQWFIGGSFETRVPNPDQWQVRAISGAGIDTWADSNHANWTRRWVSDCSASATAPDRVVQNVSLNVFDQDPATYRPVIEQAVAVLREKLPSATEIVLQPVVGPPEDTLCEADNEVGEVRAAHNHAAIVTAIRQVVDADEVGDLVAGPIPRVPSCDCFSDETGHLAACGNDAAAAALAACL